jgi:hypothetical protein
MGSDFLLSRSIPCCSFHVLEEVVMPDQNTSQSVAVVQQAAERADAISVVVNPEDTIGFALAPAFISLGLKANVFSVEVGGQAA